jgi:ABC-type Fe3+ transport system substrate-binding protein
LPIDAIAMAKSSDETRPEHDGHSGVASWALNMVAPDLVAYLPCPIKVPFEQAVSEYLSASAAPSISLQIEGNANKNEDDYSAWVGARCPADLPPLLITPGVNQLYARRFIEDILDSGSYSDVASYPRDEDRCETILRDPAGHATVLAANVTIIVVDHTRLGNRRAPRAWRDLLAPEFEGAVIMRGNGRTYCETTLLAWQKLFADDGLQRMGRAVRQGWHPAQMAKTAGTGQSVGAAVYVMPYFFARNIRQREQISIVWPEEGVIASPVTLLAKRELPPHLKAFASWCAGPTIARLFSLAGLATPHPDVRSGLPPTMRYVWSGWASARSMDLSAALSRAEAAFASGQR